MTLLKFTESYTSFCKFLEHKLFNKVIKYFSQEASWPYTHLLILPFFTSLSLKTQSEGIRFLSWNNTPFQFSIFYTLVICLLILSCIIFKYLWDILIKLLVFTDTNYSGLFHVEINTVELSTGNKFCWIKVNPNKNTCESSQKWISFNWLLWNLKFTPFYLTCKNSLRLQNTSHKFKES